MNAITTAADAWDEAVDYVTAMLGYPNTNWRNPYRPDVAADTVAGEDEGQWRVEPDAPRDTRPADTYDVIDNDGLPVTWALANLTFDQANEIAKAHNQAAIDSARMLVATAVRRHCTPSSEAYKAGGDRLIYAVADWIENPPEWVKFDPQATTHESHREPVRGCAECEAAMIRLAKAIREESRPDVDADTVAGERCADLTRSPRGPLRCTQPRGHDADPLSMHTIDLDEPALGGSDLLAPALLASVAEIAALRAENARLVAESEGVDKELDAGYRFRAERDAALARESALRAGVTCIREECTRPPVTFARDYYDDEGGYDPVLVCAEHAHNAVAATLPDTVAYLRALLAAPGGDQ